MSLVVGTNAYLSVEDMTAYCAEHLDGDVWADADDARKSAALVTATRDIDRRGLMGRRVDEDQSLAFPRCRMTGSGWACDDEVPQAVLDAVCEQSLFRLGMTSYERDRKRQQTLGVIGGSIGNANEYSDSGIVRQNRSRSPLCPEARELLRGWLMGSARIA